MKKLLSAAMAIAMILSLGVAAQARLAGDVNKDGTVNSTDALEVILYSVGSSKMIDSQRADINLDGTINSSDALDVLKIAVGSYTGALKVNDEFTTDYKKKYVDPVLKSGTFTMEMNVTADGQEMPMLMAADKDRIYASFSMEGIEAAILCKDGKTYILMPSLLAGLPVYMELEGDDGSLFEMTDAFSSISEIDADYISSSKVKYGTKNYVCEEYVDEDGNIYRFYFEGTSWKRFEISSEDENLAYEISSFKNTVDEKLFSLKGYTKVEMDMPI